MIIFLNNKTKFYIHKFRRLSFINTKIAILILNQIISNANILLIFYLIYSQKVSKHSTSFSFIF